MIATTQDEVSSLDVFIGGGGDDLMPHGGVLRDYARRYAVETGRRIAYFPNARVRKVIRAVRRHLRTGGLVNVIGHSWGGPDAYRVAQVLAARGEDVMALITLDPVAGPFRRPCGALGSTAWLDVSAAPRRPDRSDHLTGMRPLSRKPSGLPTQTANRRVALNVNHWDVDGMMAQAGGREFLVWAAQRRSHGQSDLAAAWRGS